MTGDRTQLATDVLIVGAGAAGMSAAIAAHDAGAGVMLIDRSLIGRGGATVMAQMTVAAAVGEEVPDDWHSHFEDTLKAGRGLCDQRLAELLCSEAPSAIRQMDEWRVGWARHSDGRLRATEAPGHDRPRCVYVDFLNTGPAVSKTLRAQVQRRSAIRRIGELCVVDIVVEQGAARGVVAFSVVDGRTVTIAAKSVVICTGGLTRLYARNSASLNMGGDGYALALRAGAELIDMEFVQFFPIGHLAPRLVGMDPIMWDPFRYKLGGRLLNSDGREFIGDYDLAEDGRYRATRDVATQAILAEVAQGRGSPHGGVYLSFQHVGEAKLREAFGPVIDRLAANGIDLTQQPVEVAPMAHYHMGGIKVDPTMATCVPNLFAAGEAVGGANGANRLSGNAISEALVFGRTAGIEAAKRAAQERVALDLAMSDAAVIAHDAGEASVNPAALIVQLQQLISEKAGPLRSEAGTSSALSELAAMKAQMGNAAPSPQAEFDSVRLDWFDLRNMLLVAECVVKAALARRESRGAHQRTDFPRTDDWVVRHIMRLQGEKILLEISA